MKNIICTYIIMTLYKIHPIYNRYEIGDDGTYRMINTDKIFKGCVDGGGYLKASVKGNETRTTSCSVHRLVYETFKGVIPEKYEIDHINFNCLDNRLINLQAITMSENRKRSEVNRVKFHKMASVAHTLRRNIKSIDEDGIIKIFHSKNQASKFYSISPSLVFQICDGENRCKNAFTNYGKIKFEYANDDDIVTHVIANEKIGKSKFLNEEERIEANRKSTKASLLRKSILKTWLIDFNLL